MHGPDTALTDTRRSAHRRSLSPAQAAIWLGQQIDPQSAAYNVADFVEIRGGVNIPVFEAALRKAADEADIFNMRFVERDGDVEGPWQLRAPCPDWPLRQRDFRADPDPAASARAWMEADAAIPTDLGVGPPFAQALLRLSEDHFIWYLRSHHIVLDGYGIAMVLQRSAELYNALKEGRPCGSTPFEPLAALLDSDAEYLASAAADDDRHYWADRLADLPMVNSFAGGSTLPSRTFLRCDGIMPASLVRRLDGLAEQCGTNWPDVVIAALGAYLHRATAGREIILGLPMLNRLGTVAAKVPATTANVLPLRMTIKPWTTVRTLVGQVTTELRGMRKHQRYRAEDLRRDLKLVGDGRRLVGPQINIDMFSPTIHLSGCQTLTHHLTGGPVEDFAITVRPRTTRGELPVQFTANPDSYASEDVEAHRLRFLSFLDDFTESADRPVGRFDVLTAEERRAVLGAPSVATEAAGGATLAALFEERVAQMPDARALVCGIESMSYGELDRRANQLGRALIARGARADALVALALPRSMDMLVGILAVLKAGAAYLPLDPDHPTNRIASILEDTTPILLVTHERTAATLPPTEAPIMVLDDPATRADIHRCSDRALAEHERIVSPSPDHLAYVIYTSGSTGKPKGVEITNRNVVRLFSATDHWFGFHADDVWTMFHSYAFDFSVWEIWGALLYGGRLVIVPTAVAKAPPEFLRLLVEQRVTVLNQTPSAFYQLIQADQDDRALGDRLCLRRVVFGGEALELPRLIDWYGRHPPDAPRLVNMYGITETTVHVTYQPLDEHSAVPGTGSMIGTAIPDQGVRVLDESLRLVPPGCVGEMYISGNGTARGYMDRPRLNAERFVADPFGPPGSRLYRSGDFARLHGDGRLEYVGRADQQVKIRGFRIELGEIEATLRGLSTVSDAVIIARTDATGDRSLAAYVVPSPGTAPSDLDTAGLREQLRDRLPPYMVPAAFMALERLPISPNGKVDRRNLPEIRNEPRSSRPVTEPRDAVDERVCAVWAAVLDVGEVGIDDNFFDLGGDSFKAIRVSRDIGLPVIQLFTNPTPRACADHLRNCGQPGGAPAHRWLHRLTREIRGEPGLTLVCMPYGGGSAIAYQELADRLPADIALWAVSLPGHDPSDAAGQLVPFEEAVEGCVAAILETVKGPFALYGHCAGNAMLVDIARRLEQRGREPLAIHVGAMVPDRDPQQVLDRVRSRSDQDLLEFLRSIGGFDGALSTEDIAALVRIAHYDSVAAAEFFHRNQGPIQRIRAPLHVIIGDEDPVTAGYGERVADWERFAETVRLTVLPGARHYFIKDRADEVSSLLAGAHADRLGRSTSGSGNETDGEVTSPAPTARRLVAGATERSTTVANPFEDPDCGYLLLGNAVGQHSLWPAFAAVPAGWESRFGPADREACLKLAVALQNRAPV